MYYVSYSIGLPLLYNLTFARLNLRVCTPRLPETRGWFHHDGTYLQTGGPALRASLCAGIPGGRQFIFEIRS